MELPESAVLAADPVTIGVIVKLVGRLFEEGTMAQAGIAMERAFGVAAERPAGF